MPCRSVGDVLFTFEMQGSGSSGSATPYVFTWDGTAYVASSAAGIFSSINNSTTTRGGPWGHVDSHGNWVLGNLDRFTFAEASASLSLLPGIDSCGGAAYVQVRTRSSSTSTSDLKDTSKIFQFTFLGLQGSASLTPSCEAGFNCAASATDERPGDRRRGTINPADTTFCAAQSVYATLSDTSNLCPAATSETENYSKVTTITATDNP